MEVDVGGVIWGEQLKSSARNWTISRLVSERVLADAKIQIDQGHSFRFIASSPAVHLRTLAERARTTESFEEFADSLGRLRSTHLAQVATAWGVPDEEVQLLLRRVDVEHISLDALIRIVRSSIRQLFLDDPDLVISELRNFCDDNLHLRFTAPRVWSYLESKGLRRRFILGDSSVIRSLRRTVDRQRHRVESVAPSVGFVRRSETDEILSTLQDPDGAQLMVVDGPAGTGKSKVVFDVATQLDREGWYVGLARMDSNAATSTATELGHRMGLTESPSVLLAGVAGSNPALLIVDQLDAVSTYSGRMADNFTSVSEAVSEAEGITNLKVMLVVRTVDLNADPRLVSLLRRDERVARHTIGDLAVEDMKRHLTEHGFPIPDSQATQELLCTPLHFAVYTRIDDRSLAEQYRTLQDLFGEYTAQVRRTIEERIGHLNWDSITAALINHMSRSEVLTAPAHLLDDAHQSEVDSLLSEAILVSDGPEVAFFHESYFDYLFARSFVNDGGDLCEFLMESGQYLFRRAQTRQVLEYLAGSDLTRFWATVMALLTNDAIRAHLKAIAVHILRQVEPSPANWLALEDLVWSGSPIGRKLLGLLNLPGWFDAADQLGRWDQWLGDPERVDKVFGTFTFAAQERPVRVSELVRPYIDKSEEWRERLRSLVSWRPTSGLVELTAELIEKGQLDDIRRQIATNSDFWSLLDLLHKEDPAGVARLSGAFLRRGLTRAQLDGCRNPFESGHLSRDSSSQDHSVIVTVASMAPAEFLHHVMPFVTQLARRTEIQPLPGQLPRSRPWALQHRSTVHSVPAAVLAGTDQALMTLARDDPEACSTVLHDIRNAENYHLRFLTCRALAAIDDADHALGWLLSDTRNLALGWADSSNRAASRELIKKHSVDCSREMFDKRLYAAMGGLWPRIRLVGVLYHVTPCCSKSRSR